MKSKVFKSCLDEVEPSLFQKERMLEQALKPRLKNKWRLCLIPALVVLCLVWMGLPKPKEEFSSNSMMDRVLSFEYNQQVYVQTGEFVSSDERGKALSKIESSEISELIGCVIYESELDHHVIVEYGGGYELFEVEG